MLQYEIKIQLKDIKGVTLQIPMLLSKIHRAKVSAANLSYNGSISIDTQLLEASGIREGQKVDIAVLDNGERFSTYVIAGKRGEICLNGAAARRVQVGDLIIIMAYVLLEESELKHYRPKVLLVNEKNEIIQIKEELH